VDDLLAERGIEVDHVTTYRWVETFTPEFSDAARPGRHATGDRWFVDETDVKVTGPWTSLSRAVDQHDQVTDLLVCERRDGVAARALGSPAFQGARRGRDRGRGDPAVIPAGRSGAVPG
jgi:transposase, IS6 family